MTDAATIVALVASERACYEYPDDTEVARAQREAFCAGAAWFEAGARKVIAEAMALREGQAMTDATYHAELARLREIETSARGLITEWYAYGECKPSVVDQIDALDEILKTRADGEHTV